MQNTKINLEEDLRRLHKQIRTHYIVKQWLKKSTDLPQSISLRDDTNTNQYIKKLHNILQSLVDKYPLQDVIDLISVHIKMDKSVGIDIPQDQKNQLDYIKTNIGALQYNLILITFCALAKKHHQETTGLIVEIEQPTMQVSPQKYGRIFT